MVANDLKARVRTTERRLTPIRECMLQLREETVATMAYSLREILRFFHGGTAKEKPAFNSEKEAYDFCRNLYKKSGGVTPELRRAYEFYQKNLDDGCGQFTGPRSNSDKSTSLEGKHQQVHLRRA